MKLIKHVYFICQDFNSNLKISTEILDLTTLDLRNRNRPGNFALYRPNTSHLNQITRKQKVSTIVQ